MINLDVRLRIQVIQKGGVALEEEAAVLHRGGREGGGANVRMRNVQTVGKPRTLTWQRTL